MSQPKIPHRRLRPFTDAIEGLGVTIDAIELRGSGHIGYRLRYGHRTQLFVGPLTPSDGRASKNFRSDVRRWRDI